MSDTKEHSPQPEENSQPEKVDWSQKNLNGVYGIVNHGDDVPPSYYPGRKYTVPEVQEIKPFQETTKPSDTLDEGDQEINNQEQVSENDAPSKSTDQRVKNIASIQGNQLETAKNGINLDDDSDFLKVKFDMEKERAWQANSLAHDLGDEHPAYGKYMQETDQHVTNAQDILIQQNQAWERPVNHLKSAKAENERGEIKPIGRYKQLEVCSSFRDPPEVITLDQDLTVYRYFSNHEPYGSYLSTELYTREEAIDKLSLPDQTYGFSATENDYVNNAKYFDKFTIPKGTTILKGIAAPNFNHPGGGEQIYIADYKNSLIDKTEGFYQFKQ